MSHPVPKKEKKQPITDRKLRILYVIMGAGRGLYSPVQVGNDGKGNMDFQGRRVYDYTDEEFEAVIGPYEERIRNAGQTE